MRAVFLEVFFFLCVVGITNVYGGHWSKWYDLTICSAKPCKCEGYDHKCDKGKKVMIRSCIYEGGDMSVCQYEGNVGSITLVGCRNKHVCPGWSEWKPLGHCDCDEEELGLIRHCNNPSPIHPDVLCWNDIIGEEATEQYGERYCNCTDEEREAWKTTTTTVRTTTTTTPEPTTPLPWCCEQETTDYGGSIDDYLDALDNQKDATTTTTSKPEPTKKLSQLDKDYYDYYDEMIESLPPVDCKPCTAEYGYVVDSDEEDCEDEDCGGGDYGGGDYGGGDYGGGDYGGGDYGGGDGVLGG